MKFSQGHCESKFPHLLCLRKPLIFHEPNNVSYQKMKDGSVPLQPCQNLAGRSQGVGTREEL